MGGSTTRTRRPYLGTFYGPHRDEYLRVAEEMAAVMPSLAARLHGGLGMTGPFGSVAGSTRLDVYDDEAR